MIAADGIHSELRQYVVPPTRPVFSGSVAYRGMVASELVPGLAGGSAGRCGSENPSIS